jgi:hypothetical protein
MLVTATAATAHADRRSFTNTYEYSTMPEGKTAFEFWHTQSRDTWKSDTTQRYQQILEIEHGITDHWDAALYTVLGQVAATDPTESEPLGLDSLRLETRYRLADRGELPIDTELYFEVAKDFGKSVYEIEGKGIFARDFDRFTAAANIIAELVTGHDVPDTHLILGWAAGLTYEVHPKCRLGAETWGEREQGVVTALAGPAINVAPSGNLWLTVTAGFGLSDAAPAMAARAILGVEL